MSPRILLDTCVPERLGHDLAMCGHVETARFAGLDTPSNGALLSAMAGRFEVFITVDTNLPYQQTLVGRSVSVLVLRAASNDIADLWPLIPAVAAAIASMAPGIIIEVR